MVSARPSCETINRGMLNKRMHHSPAGEPAVALARCFSTFTCADTGVFGDFYIEPAFRRRGIAWLLARAAQQWCAEHGVSSLTVCCAPCDEGMYRSLGFDTRLGTTFAHLP